MYMCMYTYIQLFIIYVLRNDTPGGMLKIELSAQLFLYGLSDIARTHSSWIIMVECVHEMLLYKLSICETILHFV